MRKNVGRLVSVLALAGFMSVGCKASFSAKAGGAPKPPTPPPPTNEPAPPPPKKPMFRKVGVTPEGRVKLPGPVVFETGSDRLAPESDAVLEVVRKYLQQNPDITKMRIEGHTDNVGQAEANETLSEKRSMSVARWLVAKGIDCKRLVPVGFGETKPIAPNNTPEGQAQNRRTAFYNAEKNGQAIGGLPVDGGGQPAGNPCN